MRKRRNIGSGMKYMASNYSGSSIVSNYTQTSRTASIASDRSRTFILMSDSDSDDGGQSVFTTDSVVYSSN